MLKTILQGLRRAEFKIGPDQTAGAQKILLLAHADAAVADRDTQPHALVDHDLRGQAVQNDSGRPH